MVLFSFLFGTGGGGGMGPLGLVVGGSGFDSFLLIFLSWVFAG
jgi:hypothetical protein